MKRYPLAPLLALTRSPETGLRMSNGELGDLLGLSACAIQKWQTAGLTDRRADQAAVALGFDPYVIWPDMLDDAIAGLDAGDCLECGEPFYKTQSKQEFCQRLCKERYYDRNRRVRNAA